VDGLSIIHLPFKSHRRKEESFHARGRVRISLAKIQMPGGDFHHMGPEKKKHIQKTLLENLCGQKTLSHNDLE
jgi:hypothetical protein